MATTSTPILWEVRRAVGLKDDRSDAAPLDSDRSWPARLPLATVLLAAALILGNVDMHAGDISSRPIGGLLANDYSKTLASQVWRPFTSWVPHQDARHLLWDLAYLAVAGYLVETAFRYGRGHLLLVFLTGNVLGSWLSVFFDSTYAGVVGPSAGTHGLVAYACIREAINRQGGIAFRAFCVIVVCYLVFLTAHGLAFGRMGWPFGFFLNSGYDHLGGIGFAVAVGMGDAARWRGKSPCRTHPEGKER